MSGWSKSALNPRVKEATGYSSMEYVLVVRLELAKQSLSHSDVPITAIAMDLGFSSSQHFSTAFRQRMGLSPSAFRQNTRPFMSLAGAVSLDEKLSTRKGFSKK